MAPRYDGILCSETPSQLTITRRSRQTLSLGSSLESLKENCTFRLDLARMTRLTRKCFHYVHC
jgi:hypothetical protein